MGRGLGPAIVLLATVAVGAAMPQRDAVRVDAARMSDKLLAIVEHGERQPPPSNTLRTSFTDREVNAYFQVAGPEFLPEGVADPRLEIGEGGQLRARALVDLNRVFKPEERSWLDPLAWMSGTLEVTAIGTLRASQGSGRFGLERAALGGVPIPKTVLQEVVRYYTRSETMPDGFDFDAPFDLPARIRSVELWTGRATVVQ